MGHHQVLVNVSMINKYIDQAQEAIQALCATSGGSISDAPSL